ncbi:MAG: hypothetical protein A3F31_02605 [Candidatus Levybacteria bacterium RIFCSPHIGHO2_12_FULL_38_12]|nr:MAG: hypothetical protein A2770_04980 [Candidatus Levybacteria bacterium RIFCSPHIGHO2_01_FULL_38_12]OGH22282.1 MAG: hypothetical protein A3F31_02605 [Candidatus Levybacteria bacterium RIFCSPHIGHO2_12_FULL_38_12]OGH44222.1 MAG: hypothetical protein A3J14_01570 [Candidatus Levybacteria bacterium RIFCSPLOWO2_02_FULL_37_18]OGH51453.1 MAG: hypothetical protein A3G13_02560 [Candidatus Levybacteria bacterium RIFCSPLOWO2_12_FULL_37_7]
MAEDAVVKPPVSQPTTSVDPVVPSVAPQVPVETLGVVRREQEEVVRSSNQEVVVPPELKEHGVEATPERPDLTLADPRLVQYAAESTPVPAFPQAGTSSVPGTIDQAQATIARTSWRDSLRYWTALVLKKLKRQKEKDAEKK